MGEDAERSAEVGAVVAVEREALAALRDHVDRRLGRETKDVDIRRLCVNLVDVLLAVVGRDAVLAVVLEERVRSCAVDPDVVALDDANGPGGLVGLCAHVWVEVLVVLLEGLEGVGVGLEVGSLGLDGAEVDVLSALEVVLRKDGVLGGSAVQPNGTLGLDEHTTTVVDVDLVVVLEVKLVVGSPKPDVLEVAVGVLGDMELHEGTNALGVGIVGSAVLLTASVGLELSTLETTNTEVNVPKTSLAVLGVDVPLHENCTGSGTLGSDDGVGHLESALVTGLLADLEQWLGVVHVRKVGASSHQKRVSLANHLDVLLGWDDDSVRENVSTVVNPENLAISEAVDSCLHGLGVVGLAVTLGTSGLKTNKFAGIDISVQRLAALEETTVFTKKALGLGGSVLNVALDTTLSAA